jgi:hypothetical protein
VVNHPPKADYASTFVVKIATFAKPENVSRNPICDRATSNGQQEIDDKAG